MFQQMVGVSVCHHIRVGIKRRKAALLELCGLLQVRVAGTFKDLALGKKRRNSFAAVTRKAVFPGAEGQPPSAAEGESGK